MHPQQVRRRPNIRKKQEAWLLLNTGPAAFSARLGHAVFR
jgi:hypothetical protein